MDVKQLDINTYDFDRYGETKYGFVVKLDTFNGQRMYVTNSKEAIELFVPVLEYAEAIQDKGVDYEITSNAILFSTDEGARTAASYFYQIIDDTFVDLRCRKLYEFNKSKYFGKRQQFIDDIAARIGVRVDSESDVVSEEELENEFETYIAAIEGTLTAYYGDRAYKIVSYDVRTGNLTADDGAILDVAECDLTFA